jgi:hypothetical protein
MNRGAARYRRRNGNPDRLETGMKASLALILAGSMLAVATLSARAAESAPGMTATQDAFAAKKDAYLKEMYQRMDQWGQKIDRYSKEMAIKGERAGKDADKDLRQAWIVTQKASRRLAAATKIGWAKAKAAFEHASARLQEHWNRQTTR